MQTLGHPLNLHIRGGKGTSYDRFCQVIFDRSGGYQLHIDQQLVSLACRLPSTGALLSQTDAFIITRGCLCGVS